MNGVAVYLQMEDWNKVLAILSQAPWNVANPLIMAMGDQLRAAQSTAAAPAPNEPARRGNGADLNP